MSKPRVFVSTDIGRDPDDMQSLIHLLHMAHKLHFCGISLCWPGGDRHDVETVMAAYKKDYDKLEENHPGRQSPYVLHNLVMDGSRERAGLGQNSEGVKWLIKAALVEPLLVLVWGSGTDLANAIQQRPEIKENIRAYVIASWNREQDPESHRFLRQQHNLHWIESETTFRGIYAGWQTDLNKRFVKNKVAPAGALGKLFARISETNVGKGALKMGDTPSLLWALTGNPNDLSAPSQGGRYKRVKGTHRHQDLKGDQYKIGSFYGAKTVAQRRKLFLADWEQVLSGMR